MPHEDLIGVPDAAQELGVQPESLYEAIHKGRLPASQFLRRYVIKRSDLDEYRTRTQPEGVPKRGRPRSKPRNYPRDSDKKEESETGIK